MQCFGRKDQLMKAFEQIKLRSEKKWRREQGRENNVADKTKQEKTLASLKDELKTEEFRCYNCNQMGHRARECTKSKRNLGSYYEWGAQGHVVRDCPLKTKKPSSSIASLTESRQDISQVLNVTELLVADNEYLKIVDFEMVSSKFSFLFGYQVKHASPISFMKEKFIPYD